MDNVREAIKALKALRKGFKNNVRPTKARSILADKGFSFDTTCGLCDYLRGYLEARTLENCTLENCFRSWPSYSGDHQYPISAPKKNGIYPSEYYGQNFLTGGLWKGRQLRKRLSLAKHIIKELEKELDKGVVNGG